MKILNLTQGSPEWHAHRAHSFNASEASAMMGVSPYMTRSGLLHALHTGIRPEPNEFEARRFAEGHRTEALARPRIAEPIIGEDLYPVVGTLGRLSASFDGITLGEDQSFEHKLLNEELRAALDQRSALSESAAALPLFHRVQMEQQLIVSGAQRVLFIASQWDGDNLVEWRGCWYTSNPDLRQQILLGWDQFAEDLANYKPPEVAVEVVAARPSALPALSISVEGRVVASNLPVFVEAAHKFIAAIKTDLKTDQDFADAAETVKFCKDGEDKLELVKSQTLAQTTSLDDLFRAIDDIKEALRQKRLQLDKLVDARKTTIRGEVVAEHADELKAHIERLNERIGGQWIPAASPTLFGDAVKGKKNIATMREACGVALAAAKIAASERADRMEANRKSLVRDGKDWFFLFADFANAGNVPAETFSAIADQRIRKQEEADRAQKEREDEAARKAAEVVAAAASKPAPAPAAAGAINVQREALLPGTPGTLTSTGAHTATAPASGSEGPAAAERAAGPVTLLERPVDAKDDEPTLTIGKICARLSSPHTGLMVTSEFLLSLGFEPKPVKAYKLYSENQLRALRLALAEHIVGGE